MVPSPGLRLLPLGDSAGFFFVHCLALFFFLLQRQKDGGKRSRKMNRKDGDKER